MRSLNRPIDACRPDVHLVDLKLISKKFRVFDVVLPHFPSQHHRLPSTQSGKLSVMADSQIRVGVLLLLGDVERTLLEVVMTKKCWLTLSK
jgi:hypothetical protein